LATSENIYTFYKCRSEIRLRKNSASDIYDGCIPLPALKIYSLRFVYYFGAEKEWKDWHTQHMCYVTITLLNIKL